MQLNTQVLSACANLWHDASNRVGAGAGAGSIARTRARATVEASSLHCEFCALSF